MHDYVEGMEHCVCSACKHDIGVAAVTDISFCLTRHSIDGTVCWGHV
jgi:hypothetical protein